MPKISTALSVGRVAGASDVAHPLPRAHGVLAGRLVPNRLPSECDDAVELIHGIHEPGYQAGQRLCLIFCAR